MLEISGLAKSYGAVRALSDVNLSVARGQIMAVLGHNGAGKSTLLESIAGLLVPDAGHIRIDDIDIRQERSMISRLVGFAPQTTGIYPILTVRQNLNFFAELCGLSRRNRTVRAVELAERLDLLPLSDRRAHQLSGGEARRLHMACSLVHSPQLLLLDEPTVGADVMTRSRILRMVTEMATEGAAVLYTTHYLPEVEALDAHIAVLNQGRIVATGSQAELMREHAVRGVHFEIEGSLPCDLTIEINQVSENQYRTAEVADLSNLIRAFGSSADRIVSAEVLRSDLETLYLKLAGNSTDSLDHQTDTSDTMR